jgi:hypothetical protein
VILISKIIVIIISCSVLSLSLDNAIQAGDKMRPDPCPGSKGGQPNLLRCPETLPATETTINGEVLRLEGDTYLLQNPNGKEVRLQVDPKTQVTGVINRGDFIEAKMEEVDGQQVLQSIREIKK